MSNKITMQVSMEVTIPQALALQAMFNHWTKLGSQGSSRHVTFFVDGDGNFQPKCSFAFTNLKGQEMSELTEKLEKLAVIEDTDGDRVYDFDLIAFELSKGKAQQK